MASLLSARVLILLAGAKYDRQLRTIIDCIDGAIAVFSGPKNDAIPNSVIVKGE
jgi:hypothetical protein